MILILTNKRQSKDDVNEALESSQKDTDILHICPINTCSSNVWSLIVLMPDFAIYVCIGLKLLTTFNSDKLVSFQKSTVKEKIFKHMPSM